MKNTQHPKSYLSYKKKKKKGFLSKQPSSIFNPLYLKAIQKLPGESYNGLPCVAESKNRCFISKK